MIVPALILKMQEAGLGTVDSDLYYEELPQASSPDGIWVVTRGDAGSTDDYQNLTIDVNARFANKIETELRLRQVVNWIRGDAQNICSLSIDPNRLDDAQVSEDITYDVISIKHVGAVQNQGLDANFRIIKTITIEIKFNERS